MPRFFGAHQYPIAAGLTAFSSVASACFWAGSQDEEIIKNGAQDLNLNVSKGFFVLALFLLGYSLGNFAGVRNNEDYNHQYQPPTG